MKNSGFSSHFRSSHFQFIIKGQASNGHNLHHNQDKQRSQVGPVIVAKIVSTEVQLDFCATLSSGKAPLKVV